jgi:hypothetical protein
LRSDLANLVDGTGAIGCPIANIGSRFTLPFLTDVIEGIFKRRAITMIIFRTDKNKGIARSNLVCPVLLFGLIINAGQGRMAAGKNWQVPFF